MRVLKTQQSYHHAQIEHLREYAFGIAVVGHVIAQNIYFPANVHFHQSSVLYILIIKERKGILTTLMFCWKEIIGQLLESKGWSVPDFESFFKNSSVDPSGGELRLS